MSTNKLKQFAKQMATRRLLRDLKEWERCKHELITISAAPLAKDIFEWHVNIAPIEGKYEGSILHVIIKFTEDYPSNPPKVEAVGGQYLNHPNVFNDGKFICLDMLKSYLKQTPYQGWTAGYSAASILIQLQSFLFGENILQDYGGYSRRGKINKERLLKMKCFGCKHVPEKPWPPLHPRHRKILISNRIVIKQYPEAVVTIKKRRKRPVAVSCWNKYLYKDVERYIFSFLSVGNLTVLTKVCKHFKYLIQKLKILQLNKYQCWFHRMNVTQNKSIILGYGINIEFFDRNFAMNSNKIINIKSCSTSFDLLSYDAFVNFNVRQSLWKSMTFSYFVPVFINEKHGKNALKLFEYLIENQILANQVQNCHSTDPTAANLNPIIYVDLILNILLTLILDVMRTCEENNKSPPLHYSINIIETFLNYYHLLLGVYIKYKSILKPIINKRIELFLRYPSFRDKYYIPNIGLFRLLLILTDEYTLQDLMKPMLEESFTRYSKFVIKNYPFLDDISTEIYGRRHFIQSCVRLNLTFEKGLTSYRTFMFLHFFLNHCCNNNLSLEQKYNLYNTNYGSSSLDLPMKLQNYCKKILKCNNYFEFFNLINTPCPSSARLNKILCKSVLESISKKYHNLKYVNRSIQNNNWPNKKCICETVSCHYKKTIYSSKSAHRRNGINLFDERYHSQTTDTDHYSMELNNYLCNKVWLTLDDKTLIDNNCINNSNLTPKPNSKSKSKTRQNKRTKINNSIQKQKRKTFIRTPNLRSPSQSVSPIPTPPIKSTSQVPIAKSKLTIRNAINSKYKAQNKCLTNAPILKSTKPPNNSKNEINQNNKSNNRTHSSNVSRVWQTKTSQGLIITWSSNNYE